jgi:hypothetical protein
MEAGQQGTAGTISSASPGVITRLTASRQMIPLCSNTRRRLTGRDHGRYGLLRQRDGFLTSGTFRFRRRPAARRSIRIDRIRHAFGNLALFGVEFYRSMAVRADRQSGLGNAGQRCLAGVRPVVRTRLRRAGLASAGGLYFCGRPVSGSLGLLSNPYRIQWSGSERHNDMDSGVKAVRTSRTSLTAALSAVLRVASSERSSRIRPSGGCPIFPVRR